MNPTTLLIYGSAIFFTAFLGGTLPLLIPKHQEHHLKVFVCLGAGLLLGMAFMHMIPEASQMLPHTFGIWFLAGFLILLILERFIMVHACEEHSCNYHTIGIAAFVGLAVHGIIEGFALASTLILPQLAILILVAILAHKAPAGFALTSIMRLGGKSKGKILLFITGVSLSGPLGMLMAYFILKSDGLTSTSGALLAMSAGTFLYIGACDLLPELHRTDHEKFRRLGAFILGIAASYVSGVLLSSHPH